MAEQAVTIRRASAADEPILRELWEEFEREVPEPDGFDSETWEQEWADTLDDLRGGGIFIAENGSGPLGVARIEAPDRGAGHIQLVYVRDRARRQGVSKRLLHECVADAKARGARTISLEVLTTNDDALAVWRRLGKERLQCAKRRNHRSHSTTGSNDEVKLPVRLRVYGRQDRKKNVS